MEKIAYIQNLGTIIRHNGPHLYTTLRDFKKTRAEILTPEEEIKVRLVTRGGIDIAAPIPTVDIEREYSSSWGETYGTIVAGEILMSPHKRPILKRDSNLMAKLAEEDCWPLREAGYKQDHSGFYLPKDVFSRELEKSKENPKKVINEREAIVLPIDLTRHLSFKMGPDSEVLRFMCGDDGKLLETLFEMYDKKSINFSFPDYPDHCYQDERNDWGKTQYYKQTRVGLVYFGKPDFLVVFSPGEYKNWSPTRGIIRNKRPEHIRDIPMQMEGKKDIKWESAGIF